MLLNPINSEPFVTTTGSVDVTNITDSTVTMRESGPSDVGETAGEPFEVELGDDISTSFDIKLNNPLSVDLVAVFGIADGTVPSYSNGLFQIDIRDLPISGGGSPKSVTIFINSIRSTDSYTFNTLLNMHVDVTGTVGGSCTIVMTQGSNVFSHTATTSSELSYAMYGYCLREAGFSVTNYTTVIGDDIIKPKTTNSTMSYNGVDYPIGIHYPIKAALSIGMSKVIDSQGLLFWRDKGQGYDKIDSEIDITIDNYNTEFNTGTQIDKFLDIMTGVIDTEENPVLIGDGGIYVFTPMHDLESQSIEIGIIDVDYSRVSDLKQRWNKYTLKITNITDLTYTSDGTSCPTQPVWSLDGIGLPNPKIKEGLPLVFADRHLQGYVDKYKVPTTGKGELCEIEITVTSDTASSLLYRLSSSIRNGQFVVTMPNPLYPFGQNYTNSSFNCILYSEKIICTQINSTHCTLNFTIQNRGAV